MDLVKKKRLLRSTMTALELCAGQGRVTKEFISMYYRKVSLHDQSECLKTDWEALNEDLRKRRGKNKCEIGDMLICDLKDIDLGEEHYDLIYGNWSIFNYSRSRNEVMIALQKCHKALSGLTPGMLICKETTRYEGDPITFHKE